MNDLEKIKQIVTQMQEKYAGYPWLQKEELLELKEEFKEIASVIAELQSEINCDISQKRVDY